MGRPPQDLRLFIRALDRPGLPLPHPAPSQAQYAVKILPKQRGAKNRTEQIKQEVRPGCLRVGVCWQVAPNTSSTVVSTQVTGCDSQQAASASHHPFHTCGHCADTPSSCCCRCCLQITISMRLQHCRHAVKTVDSFEDGRNIYVVQELCCGGDLADLMSVSAASKPLLDRGSQQPALALCHLLCCSATARASMRLVCPACLPAASTPACLPAATTLPPIASFSRQAYHPAKTVFRFRPPLLCRLRRASCQSRRPPASSKMCWSSWPTVTSAPSATVTSSPTTLSCAACTPASLT